LPQATQIIQQQWKQLYNIEEHKHLQQAIMDEVNSSFVNSIDDDN